LSDLANCQNSQKGYGMREEQQFINPNKEPFGFVCVIAKGYEQEIKEISGRE